ncbi:AAA family ATPase [Pseudoalteromonas aliena]|uniref:Endonuclease GajA/Old nuclease/RecF-like AAA domain-containing protein n=1 Tax=Pseudoalteromonas aliena SW19 TaxID=1314866 RepID=A0ABR9DU69_9GAMM|nr:AAA family ATPase [Pseudoalteromonas aliena]MBE0357904.1 hypothetical protein [Pseudoalteromonas aliena SW19]
MKIHIKNFGTIKNAEVCIGGLTVIAGENDTGKSTIGKILFSLVKAFNKIEDDLLEDKHSKIMNVVETIYFTIRKSIPLSAESDIKRTFFPPTFFEHILIHGEEAIYDRQSFLKILYSEGRIENSLFNFSLKQMAIIRSYLNESNDPAKAKIGAVRKAFYSEFRGDIVNKLTDENAKIEINDGATLILSMEWSKSELIKFDVNDDFSYDDSTYFDSSVVLQFHHFIQGAKTLFDVGHSRNNGLMVPLHVKDLSRKLNESMYTIDLKEQNINGADSDSIYGGDFYYDRDSKQFLLSRNGLKYASSNVASGIKNLGVFDMLVHGGHINNKTLTIIDEPEVNLHPDWQVKYAKSIALLAQTGANIIVTTHSPYIIEALHLYSEKFEISPSFYQTNKVPNGVEFDDVTDELSKVIDKLSRPLEDLHREVDYDF